MAIYEYFCEECNSKFQFNFPIGQAKEKVNCPSCKGEAKRIYSSFLLFSKGKEFSPSISSSSRCGTCITRNCSSCK